MAKKNSYTFVTTSKKIGQKLGKATKKGFKKMFNEMRLKKK